MVPNYNRPRQNDIITYFTGRNNNNNNDNNNDNEKKKNKKEIANKECSHLFPGYCSPWRSLVSLWFSEGKTTLIPRPSEFRSDNQRSLTCLNNLYKWYTSCLLTKANQHVETYGLIQREHRGVRGNCSGAVDNLLIDRLVCEDAQRGKWNLSMAWIDVAKAYGSVDHGWLSEMFTLHRFPIWFAKVMEKFTNSWNTIIVAQTTQGKEISPTIYVLRKDCRKVIRSVLCCSYCAWIQSHGMCVQLRDTGYLSLYQLR